jgi:hypothetical protein
VGKAVFSTFAVVSVERKCSMKFLKNFFNDESTIVGLCGFKTMRPNYSKNPIEKDFFFNPFQIEKPCAFNYETNFRNNVLLL